MPAAANFFNKALQVPRLTNLKLKSQYLSMCGISAPAKYVTQGVQADMLVLVEGAYDNEGFVAWARACSTLASTNRPIVGQVHFNFNGILPANDNDFTRDLLATMHELTHALGFSSDLFPTYKNPVKTGTVNVGGYPTQYIDVQPLTNKVREYFGCPNAPGAYLENQGGSGSAGSHWERRVFGTEYMTASQVEDFRITEITLALLESTGWYKVDYSVAEPLVWGQGKGCGFLNTYCKASNGVARFKEFCAANTNGCAVGGRMGAFCNADSFSDNCPYMTGYANSDCENKGSQSTIAGEAHGVGSKCFMSSLYSSGSLGAHRPMCFKRTCTQIGSTWALSLTVGTQTVNCKQAGPVSVSGYYGTVQCPDPNTYCNGDGKPYCRRGCMGQGTCTTGKCTCAAGWGMYDCSRRTGTNKLETEDEKREFDYDNIPDALVTDYIPTN
jgi:hypothetical protein